jgi:hypothetical protein
MDVVAVHNQNEKKKKKKKKKKKGFEEQNKKTIFGIVAISNEKICDKTDF